MIILPILTTALIRFSFREVGRVYFLNLIVQGAIRGAHDGRMFSGLLGNEKVKIGQDKKQIK